MFTFDTVSAVYTETLRNEYAEDVKENLTSCESQASKRKFCKDFARSWHGAVPEPCKVARIKRIKRIAVDTDVLRNLNAFNDALLRWDSVSVRFCALARHIV